MFWEKLKNLFIALGIGLLILIGFAVLVAIIAGIFVFLAWIDPRLCATVFCILAGLAFFLAIIIKSKDANNKKATPMGWIMASMFAVAYAVFIPITIYTKAVWPVYTSVALIASAIAIMAIWYILSHVTFHR